MSELVGLNSQVPDVAVKLGQLLDLRRGQTALASEQQTQRQRQALASYDWNKHIGQDGTIDVDSVVRDPELRAAAGDQWQEVVGHAVQGKQQQLQQKSTLLALKNEQRDTLSRILGPLRSDADVAEDNEKGRQKVNNAFREFGEVAGDDALPVLNAYAQSLQKVPKGRMSDAIRAVQMQAQDASSQVAAQQPQFTNTGAELQQTNPNAAAGRNLGLTMSPGTQQSVITDQLGNMFVQYRDQRGNIIGTAPLGGGGASSPARFGAGERGAVEQQATTNQENISKNREAAAMAPQQLDQINKALDLSKGLSTGTWASKKASIESGIGSVIPGFENLTDAAKMQELDKFSERIATDASRVLGVNASTDAQRESIHRQNANVGYSPEAIQAVLKYAKAQTMAMEAKGNAQEAFLAAGGDATKQHEFETTFRKAYDPVVFQLRAADSPEEVRAIVNKLSPEAAAKLKGKMKALREMGALDGR